MARPDLFEIPDRHIFERGIDIIDELPDFLAGELIGKRRHLRRGTPVPDDFHRSLARQAFQIRSQQRRPHSTEPVLAMALIRTGINPLPSCPSAIFI